MPFKVTDRSTSVRDAFLTELGNPAPPPANITWEDVVAHPSKQGLQNFSEWIVERYPAYTPGTLTYPDPNAGEYSGVDTRPMGSLAGTRHDPSAGQYELNSEAEDVGIEMDTGLGDLEIEW